jgi:membrane protease YdiL (CAAX protease family)
MTAMAASPRSFVITVLVLWSVLICGGITFARLQDIPGWVVIAVLPALLVEAVFYLVPGFGAIRERLGRLPRLGIATLLVNSALLPWLIVVTGTGRFEPKSFGTLLLLAAVAVGWYLVFPRVFTADLGLLVFFAAVFLTRIFRDAYPTLPPDLRLDFLGKVMWIRLGLSVFLLLRGGETEPLGFLPTRRDWKVGFRYYLLFLPFGVAAGYAVNYLSLGPKPMPLWQLGLLGVGTFVGILWVTALGEEFFFRGLLQKWIEELTGSPLTALSVASIAFGLVHLPFRGFPNWKHVLIATILGWFCGQAYQETRTIRAAMVTHALVVTTWVVVFGKS